jgi:hypothetical protein
MKKCLATASEKMKQLEGCERTKKIHAELRELVTEKRLHEA